MIEALKVAKALGKKLYLYRLQNNVREVFILLGFQTFFNIINDMSEIEESEFPKVVACTNCGKKYTVQKPGRYRCKSCTSIFLVKEKTVV
jgi:DNA-directed RNA polymerase subunit RPC12/RpoP